MRNLGELEQDGKLKDEMLNMNFFMKTVLAIKMRYSEDYNAEYVNDINAEELFKEVNEKELPFYRW